MKLRKGVVLAFEMVLLAILFGGCKNKTVQEFQASSPVPEPDVVKKIVPREDITFILGEDREYDNPFYEKATQFYRHDSNNQTEYFVSHCRSLTEVMDYLKAYPPLNKRPWGRINLVSHGNQWLGLSFKVKPESKRVSVESLKTAMMDSSIVQLSDSLVDDSTFIHIHACGIGRTPELLETLSTAFGGETHKPKVIASKKFEYYTSFQNEHGMPEYKRYLSDFWFIHYKRGYRPSDAGVIGRLIEKYPEENIDWEEAIRRTSPEFPGQAYHYTFEVPVKWVVVYPDSASLPDVSSREKQLEWLITQDELLKVIAKMELNITDFNWWFRQILYDVDEHTLLPAIWVKGYCTYLCVLKPLVDESDSSKYKEPLIPSIYDTNYYCVK